MWVDQASTDVNKGAEGQSDGVDDKGDKVVPGAASASVAASPDLRQLLGDFFMPRVQPLRCEKCGAANVKIQSKMKELPRVLVLHLKRFRADLVRNTYEKSNVKVSIPLQLEVGSCCAEEALAPVSGCVLDTVLETFSRRIECGRTVEDDEDKEEAIEGQSNSGLARKKLLFAGGEQQQQLSDIDLTSLSESDQMK